MVLEAVAKNGMRGDGCQVRSFSQLRACNTEDVGGGHYVTPETRRAEKTKETVSPGEMKQRQHQTENARKKER